MFSFLAFSSQSCRWDLQFGFHFSWNVLVFKKNHAVSPISMLRLHFHELLQTSTSKPAVTYKKKPEAECVFCAFILVLHAEKGGGAGLLANW